MIKQLMIKQSKYNIPRVLQFSVDFQANTIEFKIFSYNIFFLKF